MKPASFVLVDPDGCARRAFRPLRARVVSNEAGVREALRAGDHGPSVWIARHADTLPWIGAAIEGVENGRLRRSLIADADLVGGRLAWLSTAFDRVVAHPFVRLPDAELAWALVSPDHRDRCVAAYHDRGCGRVVFVRGDMRTLVVPVSDFVPRPVGPKPDLARLAVIDGGYAFALGEWEGSFDATLYMWDPDYRRRLNAYRRATDKTFGAALRRLRLQRELHQDAFPPLPAKTVARIERGAARKPHRRTLEILARRLRVKPEEIATY